MSPCPTSFVALHAPSHFIPFLLLFVERVAAHEYERGGGGDSLTGLLERGSRFAARAEGVRVVGADRVASGAFPYISAALPWSPRPLESGFWCSLAFSFVGHGPRWGLYDLSRGSVLGSAHAGVAGGDGMHVVERAESMGRGGYPSRWLTVGADGERRRGGFLEFVQGVSDILRVGSGAQKHGVRAPARRNHKCVQPGRSRRLKSGCRSGRVISLAFVALVRGRATVQGRGRDETGARGCGGVCRRCTVLQLPHASGVFL
ncbi:hypothetical protein B0H16DRAFT_223916 [Mycena metata]|uniref:Uncharacterized protein n=1 Tax=Mycena metata TaxID=1033252 RepID=A0AAD7MTI6_9AGAR|nr:hypothetical protein B0H16DRAFT_223916 [Mycena metata]